jgi:hypothetical protein
VAAEAEDSHPSGKAVRHDLVERVRSGAGVVAKDERVVRLLTDHTLRDANGTVKYDKDWQSEFGSRWSRPQATFKRSPNSPANVAPLGRTSESGDCGCR